jgi:thiazole synthase ThiGH ThiG subunit
MEEYDNLVEKLVLHDEQELVKLIRDKFRKLLPSKEGMFNKQEAITVTNVAKEAKFSYNTANKHKVRIRLAASEEKYKKENSHQFQYVIT